MSGRGRRPEHLVGVLRRRAEREGGKPAYVFLPRGEGPARVLTYAALHERARAIAAVLREHSPAQERALMVYPSGLEFVEAFWGCLYARLVAVPSHLPSQGPRSSARLEGIADDCRPRLLLTTRKHLGELVGSLGPVSSAVATDELEDGRRGAPLEEARADDVALLQYSSGSTASPKGVVVTHANVMANQEMIKKAFRHTSGSAFAGWLPFFHDMGLFGNIIQPLYIGSFGVLMSPLSFLQKPVRWLRAISDYRCHTAGAPNFAYEYCVRRIAEEDKQGLDLSSWRRAFNGAEKPRPETMRRFADAFGANGFRHEAFYPCYGLAETVLFVTGRDTRAQPATVVASPEASPGGVALPHASSGRPWLGSVVRVVDPVTRTPCVDGVEGEVWVSGRHVAAGYWDRPELTSVTFAARLRGGRGRRYLRTGDLGFLRDGELFLTGRLKDLVILRGRNHHPEDIEAVVEAAHPVLSAGQCAAFGTEADEEGSEELVVVVEVDRALGAAEGRELAESVTAAVSRELAIATAEVVLVRRGRIPKTSSGKVQRSSCRRLHSEGGLEPLHAFRFAGEPAGPTGTGTSGSPPADAEAVEGRLLRYLSVAAPWGGGRVDAARSLHENGLDSVRAVDLKRWLDVELGASFSVRELFESQSLRALAQSISVRMRPGHVRVEPGQSERPSAEGISEGQRALLIDHGRSPESPGANLAVALTIEGELAFGRLAHCIRALSVRHPQLAVRFGPEDQGPEPVAVEVERADACGWHRERLTAAVAAAAAAPLDLRSAAARFLVFEIGADERVLLMVFHHVSSDFTSLEIVMEDLLALLADGALPGGADAGYQRFVGWQQRWLRGRAGEEGRAFWRGLLDASAPPARLPMTASAPPASLPGHTTRFELDSGTTSRLAALAKAERTTLPALLFAAYAVMVGRMGRAARVRPGFSVAGRPTAEYARTVGYFANVLPLPVDVGASRTVRQVIADVSRLLPAALDNQDVPYARMQDAASTGGGPLVRHAFTFAPSRSGPARPLLLQDAVFRVAAGSLTVGGFAFDRAMAPFDLALLIAEHEGALAGGVTIGRSLDAAASGASIARAYTTLLGRLEETLDLPLGRLPLATDAPRSAVPPAEPGPTVVERFEAQADRVPAAVAVRHGDDSVTYRALHLWTDRIAEQLRGHGVGLESVVAVHCPRGPELVAAVLGVLKAGAAYLPIDAAHPPERLRALMERAGAAALLTVSSLRDRSSDTPVVCVDRRDTLPAIGSHTRLVEPSSLAYVIYTSGSTGRPKGVGVSQASLSHLFDAAGRLFAFTDADVWSLCHSISFDFSVWELFGALTTGGTLVTLDAGEVRDPERLAERLAETQVTVFSATPSVFANVLPALRRTRPPVGLRYVVFGGEALPSEVADAWSGPDAAHLGSAVNMYGITETTVHTTYRALAAGDARAGELAPLGEPLPGIDARVLGPDGSALPDWFVGEIAVGGAGVARGYLGQPAATASRFAPDPQAERAGARRYLSGDLGYRDRELRYAGRMDAQVKIRGHRVEPGEVESHLRACAGVEAAAVTCESDAAGSASLVAYVKGAADLSAAGLRSALSSRIPEHLIPSRFQRVDRMPTTDNGKLDSAALAGLGRPLATGESHVEARSPEERTLARIWSEVLGVPRVGIDDNYFVLGGDSIRSIDVVARARRAGLEIDLARLLTGQTIRSLAARSEPSVRPSGARIAPFALVAPGDRPQLPQDLDDAYPAPRLLQGLVFHSSFSEDYQVYVTSLHVEAPWNPDALRAAAAAVLGRHPFLRSSIDTSGFGESLQLVHSRVEVPFAFHDIRGLTAAEQDGAVRETVAVEGATRFDWERAPLLRFVVHRRGPASFQITLADPYLDGWCVALLFRELLGNYAALLAGGTPAPRPDVQVGQPEMVALERAAIASEATRTFWRRNLDGCPDTVFSGTHRPDADGRGLHDRLTSTVSAEVLRGLDALAEACAVPPRTVLLGAHLALVARVAGQADVLSGVIHNGRPEQEGGTEAIGSFLNTVPFRLAVDPNETWSACLQRVLAAEGAVLPHRRFPFAEMRRLLGRELRFDTVFNYTHFHALADLPGGDAVRIVEMYASEQTFFPLTVHFNRSVLGESLELLLDYDCRRVGPALVAAMADAYLGLLGALASAPASASRRVGETLAEVDAPLRPDVRAHVAPGARPGDGAESVVEWLERVARERPDAVAVVEGGSCVTYRQLISTARRLAALLVLRHGLALEERVGLHATHSCAAVVGMLGVLMAGGAYVPLDADCPPERMRVVVEDCRLRCVLTEESLAGRIPADGLTTILVDRFIHEDAGGLPAAAAVPPHPERLAYVMFTSGSTGRPKGVGISHGSLVNLARCAIPEYGIVPEDRVLQFCTLEFDISVEEIFMCLCAGARLVLRPPDLLESYDAFHDYLAAEQVSCLNVPTALWNDWVHDLAATRRPFALPVRVVVIAGEAMRADVAEKWAASVPSRVALVNTYGPTETTVKATKLLVERGTERVGAPASPIGVAFGNAGIAVLNPQLHPVPPQVYGELYVGGLCVARGYEGRPGLTAERFVPDPEGPHAGARRYRTGDVVFRDETGAVFFVGRRDRQVKVHGFRVEPEEVEVALCGAPGVRQAAVIAEAAPGRPTTLKAFVRMDDALGPVDRSLRVRDLREWLEPRVPRYMIPVAIELVDELPTTLSGKIDRPALDRLAAAGRPDEPASEDGGLALTAVLSAYAACLDAPGRRPDADFFALGGDSLVAMRVASRLRAALSADVSVRDVFEHPRAGDLASTLARRLTEAADRSAVRPVEDGRILLSFAQERIWIAEQLGLDAPAYNMGAAVSLSGPLDVCALEASLDALQRRHAVLRTRIRVHDGSPSPDVAELPVARLRHLDLAGLPAERRQAAHERARESLVTERFDLELDAPLRVGLFRLAAGRHELVFAIHHIAADGWSVAVLIQELIAAYVRLAKGEPAGLQPLPIQYSDYALRQRQALSAAERRRLLSYWREALAGAPDMLRLPLDRPRAARTGFRGRRLDFGMDAQVRSEVLRLARLEGVTPFMVLLAAYKSLLHRWSGQTDIVVGTPVSSRDWADTEGLIGLFVNQLVVRTDLGGEPTYRALLRRVRQSVLLAYDHRDLPFEELVAALRSTRGGAAPALLQSVFAFRERPWQAFDIPGLAIDLPQLHNGAAKYDLEVQVVDAGERGFQGYFEYRTALFDADTVGRLALDYVDVLRELCARPDATLGAPRGGPAVGSFDQAG